jgi:hypothetical protein
MILRRRQFNLYAFVRMFCMSGLGGEVPAEAPAVDPLPANPLALKKQKALSKPFKCERWPVNKIDDTNTNINTIR